MASIDYEERLINTKERIQESNKINQKNKKLILDFSRDLKIHEYSDARNQKLINHLKRVCEENDIDLKTATKEDIKDIAHWIKACEELKSNQTEKDYRIAIKVFYKWLKKDDPQADVCPELVDWLSSTLKGHKNLPNPQDMLSPKDIHDLIKQTSNPRDAVLVSVLWETGARIGEILALKIQDLDMEYTNGVRVTIQSEKNSGHYLNRTIPLYTSYDYLKKWLNNHPFRQEEDFEEYPLFTNVHQQKNSPRPRMEYRVVLHQLKKAKKQADLSKPVNPHNFRHSRATYLATKLTEAELRKWFGWTRNSDQPGRYVHLANEDLENALTKIHKDIDNSKSREKSIEILEPQSCPKCGETGLRPEADFCDNCMAPLNPDEEKLKKKANKEADEVLSKKEIQKLKEIASKR